MSAELRKGAPVRYWPGFRDGKSRLGRLRSGLATIGGTEGYYVEGAGFISAGHIEALDHHNGVIEVLTVEEALTACDWDGFTDVVITDNNERIRMQKLLKGFRGLA
ncbi:hypothetical protein SEA_BRUHMOMENT_59 [Arthrobacter phage BruhMoment]|nr:hypothetical protein SEA_BRUHMOMENT_59 [Arthrobacter phage BruhMoment]